MLTNTLLSLFERDLDRVIDELKQYQTESAIWRTDADISNSAGNLALHLVGNLNTYIGMELGNRNYVRNRELEFSAKDISRKQLIDMLNGTIEVVKSSLSELKDQDLVKDYPVLKFNEVTTTEYVLVHLAMHLSYHLGQINYHRRLIDR